MASQSSGLAAAFEELDLEASLPTGAGAAGTISSKPDSNTDANVGTDGGANGASADGAKGSETTKFKNEEATQLLERLETLGITPDKAEEISTKAGAFDSVVEMLQSDPRAFLDQIRLNNPRMFWGLMEKATDLYLELKPPSGQQGGGNSGAGAGSTGSQQDNPVMDAITDLRRRMDERDERDQASAVQQRVGEIRRQYNEKLDGLLGKIPDLSARDRKAIKALVNDSVSQDQKALGEINRGQFTSLARHSQMILNEWTADTKTAASNDAQKRAQVTQAGTRTVPNAADQAGGQQAGRKDDWEDVGVAFARDLTRKK